MKTNSFIICLVSLVFSINSYCQEKTYALKFKISVAENIRTSFKQKGRLFIFIDTNSDIEPRLRGPHKINNEYYLFGKNFSDWKANETLTIDDSEGWAKWARTQECVFENIPEATYYIQILWDQDFRAIKINAEGNMYSKKQKVYLTSSQNLTFILSEIIEPFKLVDHKLLKLVQRKSDTLSRWSGKPIYERAAILLPSKYYENPGKEYPIRYNVGGGFGSLDYVNNRVVNDTEFFNWWLSDEAPQIIIVYLDGELNGNIYHVDSDNKGPFGYSLINEFIPYIENLYRGTDSPDTRFTDGCSTGGFGSLALQLYYPETFNGVFSYSPDFICFENFFTVDIYNDKNVFYNEYGYPRPLITESMTKIYLSIEDKIKYENVLGHSGTYVDSPHWFGVMTSLFGAKGIDGKPVPLFDPETGDIDKAAIESWHRYDLTSYVRDNWESIGTKLQGKIYIWVGTEDSYYSNIPVKYFSRAISDLENPKSDAIIEFAPNWGHCWNYSQKRILEQIAKKLDEMNEN